MCGICLPPWHNIWFFVFPLRPMRPRYHCMPLTNLSLTLGSSGFFFTPLRPFLSVPRLPSRPHPFSSRPFALRGATRPTMLCFLLLEVVVEEAIVSGFFFTVYFLVDSGCFDRWCLNTMPRSPRGLTFSAILFVLIVWSLSVINEHFGGGDINERETTRAREQNGVGGGGGGVAAESKNFRVQRSEER